MTLLTRLLAIGVMGLTHCTMPPTPPQARTMSPIFQGQTATPRNPERPAQSPRSSSLQSLTPPPSPAAWQFKAVAPPVDLRGGAVHHSLKAEKGGERVTLHLVRFNPRNYRLKVIDQPVPAIGGRAIADTMRANQAAAGINGGFFTPEFTPLGLMISSGRSTGVYQPSALLTGLVLTSENQPYLIWNNEFQGNAGVSDLVQSGPRLIDSGRSVNGLTAQPRRARSFIASDGGSHWVFGTTSACNLATLADLLADKTLFPGVRLLRALNLDGGNSTALWMQTADGREISSPGWSTVRNYLAIIPKPL